MLEIISNFLFFIGCVQLALAGIIFLFLAFPDKPGVSSLLHSKRLQRSLIDDYKQRRAKVGGILGIMLLLTKFGGFSVGLGALLWLVQKAANYLPLF